MEIPLALRLAATEHEHDVAIYSDAGFCIGENGVWENSPRKARLLELHERAWRQNDHVFSSFTVDGPVDVCFENKYRRTWIAPFRPFERVFVAGEGSVFGDKDLIAKYLARTLVWRVLKSETYWPYMLLKRPSALSDKKIRN